MKKSKTKPKKCGLCDDCNFKLYKDDYVVSCAYFRTNVSYLQILLGGGCRAFAERVKYVNSKFFKHLLNLLFKW